LIGRYILVDDDVVLGPVLKNGSLNFYRQHMFIVSNRGDFAPLSLTVEAGNAETCESDKRGGGAFLDGHDILLILKVKNLFQLRVLFCA
jgi:hypothetical protein